MKQGEATFSPIPPPLGLLLRVLAIVFLAEVSVMFLLPALLPHMHTLAAAIVDAAMLTVLSAPFLWWVVVRPLRSTAVAEGARARELLHLQRLALESAANAIIITDREGRITWVNPGFTRLTGYTTEEAIGQTPRLLKSGQHDQAFYQNLWETILSDQVWEGEIINRRKDGSLFVDEQITAPVREACGTISHFVVIRQDVTECKRMQEALSRWEQRSLSSWTPWADS